MLHKRHATAQQIARTTWTRLPIPSHPIPCHPMASYPITAHPIPSDPTSNESAYPITFLERCSPYSTFCGRCEAVCPMDIPLPGMMRHLREKAFSDNIVGKRHRFTLKAWNFFLKHPRLYYILLKISTRLIYLLSKRKGYIAFFPGINAWTKSRDLPSSEGKTFMELWKRQNGK